MKFRGVFLALFIILLPERLKAEEVACAFGELARNPATDELSIYAEFKNDSYSVLPKDKRDWDDLRSYGFFVGVSMRKWRFGITADSLIHRTDIEADGKRTDELYFTIDGTIAEFSAGPVSGGLALGAGVMQLGNLESSWLQKTTHEIYGTWRQMPMDYESIDTPTAFSGHASGGLKSALAGIPVEVDGSMEMMTNGFMRAQTLFALDLLPGDPHWTAYAGSIFASRYDSFGTVFASVIESEAGDFVGTTFRAGNLQTGFAYNIRTGRPAGYAAWRYPKPETNYNAKRETSMEFQVNPLIAGVRIRKTYGDSNIAWSPCLGAESGPSGFDIGGGLHYRHSLAYLGMDMAYSFFEIIDIYAMIALGERIDQQRTCVFEESRTLKEASSQDFIAEAGTRIFIPSSVVRNPEWGLAISGGTEYYTTIRDGFFPYFRLALVSRSGRHSDGR